MPAEMEVTLEESNKISCTTQNQTEDEPDKPPKDGDVQISIDDNVAGDTKLVTTEFSQEKDAPEVAVRVYDFNMVKQKTLSRHHARVSTICSSPKAGAWCLVGAFAVITTMILVWFFMIE